MHDAIYERPDDYDLEHRGDDRDVRFYQRLAARVGATRVLELASGSGRVAVPLAAALLGESPRVVGVELSDEMLATARRKRERAGPAVRARLSLEQGDMRTWRSDERFDLVLVACSSITHLHTIDDQLALWRTAFHHLVPGGRFALDITLPDLTAYAESLRLPPRALVEVDLDQRDPASGDRLIRRRTTRFDVFEQRADILFFYDRVASGGVRERYVSDFAAHVYFPRELQLLFRLAGFELDAVWADYGFQPPRAGAREIVMAGRKPSVEPRASCDDAASHIGRAAPAGSPVAMASPLRQGTWRAVTLSGGPTDGPTRTRAEAGSRTAHGAAAGTDESGDG